MIKQVKLQNILLPMDMDSNFVYYPAMTVKGRGASDSMPLCHNEQERCHILPQYGIGDFITYFNILQIQRWKQYTEAETFYINLTIRGKVSVAIYEVYKSSVNVDLNLIKTEVIESAVPITVPVEIPESEKKLVGFRMTALKDTEIYEGYYSASIDEKHIRPIKLSLVTTTFKKQDYIKRNMLLLKEKVLYDTSDLKGRLFVHVIDNERALVPEEYNCADLKIYPNPNVGGAGGFTRGMIEALNLEEKPTHILLMDDDIMLMPESLFRTFYLLRIIKPKYYTCFLSGAMFDYDTRELQYEDVGYVHSSDGSYGPVKPRFDMQNLAHIVKNENYINIQFQNTYAGWWFCCIPVEHIEKRGLPLPVFVRGDDVEFALRNQPGFITLNGIAVWHVGFAGKFNAAMELYQVHRNSFIIQAAGGICPDINFIRRIRIFFWKEITRFAYNNAELLLDAVDDYMKGPEFLENLNGENSLKEHAAKNDKLVSLASLGHTDVNVEEIYNYKSLNIFEKAIYALTLNGHLLPGFILRKRPAMIAYDWFYMLSKNFMRKYLVAVNPTDMTGCIRTINRQQCIKLIARYMKTMGNYRKNHKKVNKRYREHFEKMTSIEFWKDYLKI